jgi:sterol desaturase/sphingolipid hydroxylase (fatty acid hydroxylase superfamily)
MAWWNAPVIISIGGMPVWVGAYLVSLVWPMGGYTVGLTSCAVFVSYYATYEYLHWCMHWPKARRLERWRVFQRLNGHHLLHHRYPGKNLNVVYPWADRLWGTLLERSPVSFAQARGPAVPDVQPVGE